VEATRAAIAKRKAEEAEKEAERAKEPVEAQVRNAPMFALFEGDWDTFTHFTMNYEENFAEVGEKLQFPSVMKHF